MSDHRHIDPETARLSGEAAQLQRDPPDPGFPVPNERPAHRPAGVAVDEPSTTYYDQPVIKQPVWIWSVPAYFYTGGVAAGTALIGAAAQAVDRDGFEDLIRRCRWFSAGGTALGTVFLIVDLGRPARFLNMLRVFRPTSAMSMGSWTLAAATGTAGAAVVLPRVAGRPGQALGNLAAYASGTLAPVLGTYTAVLIADTAVPVWHATRRALPRFFAASSLVAATSALELAGGDDRAQTIVRRLGTAAKVADLVTGAAVDRAADEVPRVGKVLHEGVSGAVWRAGKLATGASLVAGLLPLPRRWRRWRQLLSGLLGTAGAIAARFGIFHAGKASARDPRATFEAQRQGHGAEAVDGRAAVTGPDGERATARR